MIEVPLNGLAGVITSCWSQAEAQLRQEVAEKHSSPSEEDTTFLLRGNLR